MRNAADRAGMKGVLVLGRRWDLKILPLWGPGGSFGQWEISGGTAGETGIVKAL